MTVELAREALSDAAWKGTNVYSARLQVGPLSGRGPFQLIVSLPGIGTRLTLETEGDEPEWVVPVFRALSELLTLSPDWDSYGAARIEPRSIGWALEALSWIMRNDTKVPTVVPTPDGGVQLEWHTQGIDLEIEVSSVGRSFVTCYDRNQNAQWEGELRYNLNRLQDIIRRVSRRS